tara:strand:+ start:140 stop:322 length:183 start_codon:yes stop_codon:yes gene_type:complete
MNKITGIFYDLCKVINFPKYWDYDDIVVYALNFAFNNADAINDDFIVFVDDIKKYKNENK